MLHQKRSIPPALIFALLLSAIAAEAATYYVSTTGNDANSCAQAQSVATAKQTIPAGVACLVGGDTLLVRAGTYPGQEVRNPPSGSSGAYTIIKGYPGDAKPQITNVGGFTRCFYTYLGSATHH